MPVCRQLTDGIEESDHFLYRPQGLNKLRNLYAQDGIGTL
jgi:hypothetical protein